MNDDGWTMTLEELSTRAERCKLTKSAADGYLAARPMPSLTLLRRDAPSALAATLYEPVLCLILHGRKEVSLGDETLSFGRAECLLVSHVLPVHSRITKAPYLALVFSVDVAEIRRLNDEVGASASDRLPRAAETQRADGGLLDALCRYVALADCPADANVLGPLVLKEIHYRLLTAPFGGMLRSLIRHDSHASTIGRAIGHIRGEIRAHLDVPKLARQVGMSASSFHKHFRAVTSTTPLQYQKDLRLIEARRLLRFGGASVSSAAFEVGYESPSQFSREYARKFGLSPSHDTASADS
jgi:AraC-like DNA-binding protein